MHSHTFTHNCSSSFVEFLNSTIYIYIYICIYVYIYFLNYYYPSNNKELLILFMLNEFLYINCSYIISW
jgi:hypothetical protein